MFQGMIELADELDKVSSVENHLAELQTDKSKLMEQNDKLVQDLIQANASIEKANLEFNQILADAKATSDQMIKNAEAAIKTKHDEAEKSLSDLILVKEQNLKELNDLIDSQDKVNNLIKSQIEEHQVVLKDLKEAIASIKEKF